MSKLYLALFAALLAGAMAGPQSASAQLNGAYTINPAAATGGTNFQTFAAATSALTTQGINAPVTFNVTNATYNEQIIIPQVTGTSAANTITFNGNGATISYNSTVTTERAVWKLNGADYVTIDSFTITASGTLNTEYGYGIQLLNDANFNTIKRCDINSNSTTSQTNMQSNYAGIVVNGVADASAVRADSRCDSNTITNNTVTGGFFGIILFADSMISTIKGNKVIGNTVRDFYNAGICLSGNDGTIVEGNDMFRRPGSLVYQFMGVKMDKPSINCIISKNRMHNPFGTNAAAGSGSYGVYAFNCFASAGNENIFSNNVVYDLISNGITGGMEFNGVSGYHKIIHNTISLDDVNSAGFGTNGIAINSAANGFTIVNNNVSVSRGGLGTRYSIYILNTAGTGNVIDNNNWSTRSSTSLAIGYYGGSKLTLADWTSASGFDVNGLSIDPLFTAMSAGNYMPLASALFTAGRATAITTDILNNTRNAVTPTIGAYESTLTCALPTTLAVSGTTSAGTTASWASGAGNHRVQYGVTGFTLGTGTVSGNLIANSYAIGGLLPSTTYQFYVRDSCGPGNLSGWAGPFSFTTDCAAPAAPVAPAVSRCGEGTVVLTASSTTPGATFSWYTVPVTGAGVGTGASFTTPSLQNNATYYVSAVSGTCESARTPVAVTIHAKPVVNLGNDTTICAGTTITLSAGNAGATYLWYNAAITQTMNAGAAGTYFVTVTDANLCTGSDTIVVTAMAKATVAGINIVVSGTNPREITCTAVAPQNVNAYEWNFGDNGTATAAAPVHVYTQNGTYTVTLKVRNNCGDSTVTKPVTIASNGIVNVGKEAAIQLYPNPASDVLTLSMAHAPAARTTVLITDAAGRTISVLVMTGKMMTVPVAHLSSGIYFVHVINDKEIAKGKFIRL